MATQIATSIESRAVESRAVESPWRLRSRPRLNRAPLNRALSNHHGDSDRDVDRSGLQDTHELCRGERDQEAARPAVDVDARQLEDGALDVDGHRALQS